MKNKFKTHTNEIVTGERLTSALSTVANDYRELAHAIRKEDAYAPHVTVEQKEHQLNKMLKLADEVEKGEVGTFTVWQRVNTVLTGECVALLP